MSDILQLALFLASLAALALTACVIPLLLQARHQLDTLARYQAGLDALLKESRELIRNVNALALRASREMDDLGRVVHIARQWTERADQFAGALHALAAPPVLSVLNGVSAFREGTGVFMKYLFGDRNHHSKEGNHV